MAFNPQSFISGLGGMFGGLFGNSGSPYEKGMDEYQKWAQQGINGMQPYNQAGQGAMADYQKWLQNQKDPSAFINNMMNQYKESPQTQFLQQQAQRAGQNFGSANGLSGSSALMQQMQNNAGNIASSGMNDWMQKVLGINSQYGQGQQHMMDNGMNSANSLANMYNQMGQTMGSGAYGQQAGKNQDFWNTIGGLGNIIGSFF